MGRIQAGVVKRTAKELDYYRKEADDFRSQIEKMKSDGEDEYMIGKRGELLQETVQTSEDTVRRLGTAVEKLELILSSCDKDPTVIETKEFQAAKEALSLAKNVN